jgi:hypothetical protein
LSDRDEQISLITRAKGLHVIAEKGVMQFDDIPNTPAHRVLEEHYATLTSYRLSSLSIATVRGDAWKMKGE